MKYRKTGIAIACSFWIATIFQLLYVLYPQSYAFGKSYQLLSDVVCISLVVAVYLLQRKQYAKKHVSIRFELHAGHVFGIAGACMKIMAEFVEHLHTSALLFNVIAILLLLISMLLMLRADSYEERTAIL